MRIIYSFFFLITFIFFGEIAGAQVIWHSDQYGYYSNFPYDTFGITSGGYAQFEGDYLQDKSIDNFYAAGGEISNSGQTLVIDRYRVTPDTLGTMKKNITDYGSPYSNVSINELTLQTGKQTIAGQYDFGTDSVVGHVTLTNSSVSTETFAVTGSSTGQDGMPQRFSVENFGTIANVDMEGGTLRNYAGIIQHLTYKGGNYEGSGGTIETLSLAADSKAETWETVKNLTFAGEGTGLVNLTLTAFMEGNKPGFKGIQVEENIDFTQGKIVLDMSGIVNEMSFSSAGKGNTNPEEDRTAWFYQMVDKEAMSAASLFGAKSSSGLQNMEIRWGDDSGQSVAVMNNGEWQREWAITGEPTEPTPEPATLAVLGLGLAGLAMSSRRRRRK